MSVIVLNVIFKNYLKYQSYNIMFKYNIKMYRTAI